jgi:hypothetical protein
MRLPLGVVCLESNALSIGRKSEGVVDRDAWQDYFAAEFHMLADLPKGRLLSVLH